MGGRLRRGGLGLRWRRRGRAGRRRVHEGENLAAEIGGLAAACRCAGGLTRGSRRGGLRQGGPHAESRSARECREDKLSHLLPLGFETIESPTRSAVQSSSHKD